jgi:hypothetical protein
VTQKQRDFDVESAVADRSAVGDLGGGLEA